MDIFMKLNIIFFSEYYFGKQYFFSIFFLFPSVLQSNRMVTTLLRVLETQTTHLFLFEYIPFLGNRSWCSTYIPFLIIVFLRDLRIRIIYPHNHTLFTFWMRQLLGYLCRKIWNRRYKYLFPEILVNLAK